MVCSYNWMKMRMKSMVEVSTRMLMESRMSRLSNCWPLPFRPRCGSSLRRRQLRLRRLRRLLLLPLRPLRPPS